MSLDTKQNSGDSKAEALQRPYVRLYLDEMKDPLLSDSDLLRLLETRAVNLRVWLAKKEVA